MARRSSPELPRVSRLLTELGQNIRLARMRRELSAALVAERAGLSRPTLRSIERGNAGVTLGSVANVLQTLGLAGDLAQVARADELGRQLEDARLQTKQRTRRSRRSGV